MQKTCTRNSPEIYICNLDTDTANCSSLLLLTLCCESVMLGCHVIAPCVTILRDNFEGFGCQPIMFDLVKFFSLFQIDPVT